jgi:hypothetical protein
MIWVVVLVIGVSLLSMPDSTQAIIILPALLLIPLAKILAVIVSAFVFPVASFGVLLGKITRNRKLALAVTGTAILIITGAAIVVLKLVYPANPWF